MDNKSIYDLYGLVKDEYYALKFHDSIKGSFIPQDMPFSFGGGAIDYTCAYVLFRCINQTKPKMLLELGMGQSTKIFMSYVESTDENVSHKVVEHDEEWIKFFSKENIISSKTEIITPELRLEDITINNQTSSTYYYKDFEKLIGAEPFDLIFIDGPFGWNNPLYSRIDCAKLLPGLVKESFVIVIHDIYRTGEHNTFEYMIQTFRNQNIECKSKLYSNTGLIVSQDNRFLCSI